MGLQDWTNGRQAFRWSDAGGLELLGVQSGANSSTAWDANLDGSVVVGVSEITSTPQGQAFKWTPTTGLVPLGYSRPGSIRSEAFAVNATGEVTIGENFAGGQYTAWVHTDATGMRELPILTGTNSAQAKGVNSAGSRVVGQCGNQAVMWTDEVVQSLSYPPGFIRSEAFAVSDEGGVVVGALEDSMGRDFAGIWTPQHGMELLSTYLSRAGIAIPAGVTLRRATEISTDGMVIAGYTGDDLPGTDDPREGFVVYIPAPGAAWALGFGLLAVTRRRR